VHWRLFQKKLVHSASNPPGLAWDDQVLNLCRPERYLQHRVSISSERQNSENHVFPTDFQLKNQTVSSEREYWNQEWKRQLRGKRTIQRL